MSPRCFLSRHGNAHERDNDRHVHEQISFYPLFHHDACADDAHVCVHDESALSSISEISLASLRHVRSRHSQVGYVSQSSKASSISWVETLVSPKEVLLSHSTNYLKFKSILPNHLQLDRLCFHLSICESVCEVNLNDCCHRFFQQICGDGEIPHAF